MGAKIYFYISMLKYPVLYIFFSLIATIATNFITHNTNNFGSQYAIIINATAAIITFQYILKNHRAKPEVQSTFLAFKKFDLFFILTGILIASISVIWVDTILYVLDSNNIFPGQFQIYKENIQSLFSGHVGVIEIILLSTLIPLFEEFLFRGLLFSQLKNKFQLKIALIIQITVFGLIHGLPIQIVYGSIIGLIFSALYIYSSSLWTPFVCHMFFNLLNLVQYFVNEKSPNKIISIIAVKNAYIIISITSALLIGIFIYLHIRCINKSKALH